MSSVISKPIKKFPTKLKTFLMIVIVFDYYGYFIVFMIIYIKLCDIQKLLIKDFCRRNSSSRQIVLFYLNRFMGNWEIALKQSRHNLFSYKMTKLSLKQYFLSNEHNWTIRILEQNIKKCNKRVLCNTQFVLYTNTFLRNTS